MIDCRFKPIEKWPLKPTPHYMRRHSRFKAGWQATLDLLERELNQSQPGVILSFSTKQGRMVIPCDRYRDWEANLRAIALTLEHLRAVERYGATSEKQEQYTGWLRLPEASAVDEATECAKVLIQFASVGYAPVQVLSTLSLFDSVWREAVRRTHPDTNNGRDGSDFRKVIDARDRIKTLKGWQ